MALFSLLLALFIERVVPLGEGWQFNTHFFKLTDWLKEHWSPQSGQFLLLALLGPGIAVYLLLEQFQGVMFGLGTMAIWVLVILLSIGCCHYRRIYKHYLLAASQGDSQACYHLAAELADQQDLDSVSESMLGAKVGQQLAWINYRYYTAIIIMVILTGPVGVVFYCCARGLQRMACQQQLEIPVINRLMFILDWLPSRLVALGYVLVGNFAHAIGIWGQQVMMLKQSPCELVSSVAMASEQLSYESDKEHVCMESTCRLVSLAKRNLLLIISLIAVMTILGSLR